MPNYVDYSTENLNGTPVHTFMDANGQPSPPLFGPEADGLANNIAQFKAFRQANGGPDMRVAGPGGMSVDTEASVDPGSGGPAQPTPSAAGAPPAPGYSQADADAARAGPTPIGPPVAPGFAEQQQATAKGQAIHDAAQRGDLRSASLDPSAFINAPVTTKGVSRADLEKRAANVVAIPKSGEETVEGAAPYDQDAAEARAQANIDLRLAKQQQADLIAARAERDAHAFDQQAATSALRIQHEQQKQQLIEDGVNQDAATARDFRDQVAKQQVDPNRLFSGDRGALNTVLAVVGNGLGAFAAAGGGSPTVGGRRAAAGGQNYAKQIIDGAIDRDIRAQEVNIRTNQENANNQLNDIYKRIGDMTQAKSVLRQMQSDYVDTQHKALAARDGSDDAQSNLAVWDASNAADRAEQERKFLADSYGKHTVKVAQQFASPQAGGSRAPTYQEQLAKAEALAKFGAVGLSQQKDAADLEHTKAETNKLNTEAATPGGAAAQAKYNEGIQFVDSAQGSFSNALKQAGGSYDTQTGEITWGKDGLPGAGITRSLWQSSDAKKVTGAVNIGAPAIEKGVEGDAAGEAGIAQIKESLTTGNEDTRKAAWEQLGKTLALRRQSVDSGAAPSVRATRAANGRGGGAAPATRGGIRAEE